MVRWVRLFGTCLFPCLIWFFSISCGSGANCPDGVVVAGTCWPTNCTDRDCPEGFACINEVCFDPACAEVTCAADQACAGGSCYPQDCVWRTCPGLGEVCVSEDCLPASCVGVTCPEDQRCAAGRCYPVDCQTHTCSGYGEVCVEEDCMQRSCVGVRCPPDQACAQGSCYPQDCTQTACNAEGEVCVDGVCQQSACVDVICAEGHGCAEGWCVPLACEIDAECDDGNPCTDDHCDPVDGCQYQDNTNPCDDGDPCTMSDRCGGGSCSGEPLDRDEDGYVDDACGGDDCDDGDGQIHPGAAESSGAAGTCSDGKDNDCDGDTDGQDNSCGACGTDPDCDDGDACNGRERCVDGACLPGTPLDCDDGNDCTNDACLPASGCSHIPAPDGTTCGVPFCDGLVRRRHTCRGGACTGTSLIEDCDDGEPCTNDGCDPSGCSNPPAPDGTACGEPLCIGLSLQQPVCQAGACSGTDEIDNCDDANSCTLDGCDPVSGCSHTYQGDNTQCGPLGSDRCCDGSCVDIRSDPDHCGGCGAACAAGLTCEDVAATTGCTPHPEGTSGRCFGCTANSQCPYGQVCRWGQPTYNQRCAPASDDNCAADQYFVDVSSCPNYCAY